MKKLFLGFSLLGAVLLASCGGKDDKDDEKEKVVAKTDETDLTKYTATTGAAIYSSVNQTKYYDLVSVAFGFSSKTGKQTQSASGTAAYKSTAATALGWMYDGTRSVDAGFYYNDIASYNSWQFDGLYFEYNSFTLNMTSQGYQTINWYTNNDGGYRLVGLHNEDYTCARIVVEWDNSGYRTTTNFVAEGYNDSDEYSTKEMNLVYSYSSSQQK